MRSHSFHSRGRRNSTSGAFYNGRPIRIQRERGQYIAPERFINKATEDNTQATFIAQNSFQDFHFDERLFQNVKAHGYQTPTAIQDAAIRPVMEGRDLIGLADTGSGKTAAFLLPILQKVKNYPRGNPSVLIMVPTRELATQIEEEFKVFSWGLNVYSVLCVGGASLNRQRAELRKNPQVVIGTPGRLKDLQNQRILRLESVKILVLDEADRMLDMGFIRDIRYLIAQLPRERQTLCFSATMPKEIEYLVQEITKGPLTVSVKTSVKSEFIDQDIIKATSKEEKLRILSELLYGPDFEKVLVFGRTKWGVQKLSDSLNSLGHSAESIHGNKSQPQRQRALDSFKENRVKILVATDVASRGLDIPDVSHVINFDQPDTYEDYIHRIGRTGRAGKSGRALTFVS